MVLQVICFRKVSAEEQIKDLLRKKNFKEAISLVEELECEGEMTKEMLSFVHAQVGFLLLFDLHFEDAVNHFLQSESMQPSEIFPFIMRDPNRWSHLVLLGTDISFLSFDIYNNCDLQIQQIIFNCIIFETYNSLIMNIKSFQ